VRELLAKNSKSPHQFSASSNPGQIMGRIGGWDDDTALFAAAVRLLTASDDQALAAEFATSFCGPAPPPPPPLLAALATLAGRQDTLGSVTSGDHPGDGEGSASQGVAGAGACAETVAATLAEAEAASETEASEGSDELPAEVLAELFMPTEVPADMQRKVLALVERLLRAVSSRSARMWGWAGWEGYFEGNPPQGAVVEGTVQQREW
jgi:hypothetical protein